MTSNRWPGQKLKLRCNTLHRQSGTRHNSPHKFGGDKSAIAKLWEKHHKQWIGILHKDLHLAAEQNWKRDDTKYEQLRLMFLERRIILLTGNLDGKKTVSSIARFIEILNIPIHMLYLKEVNDGGRKLQQTRVQQQLSSLRFSDATRVFSIQGSAINIIDGYTFKKRLLSKKHIWWDRGLAKNEIWTTGRIPISVD